MILAILKGIGMWLLALTVFAAVLGATFIFVECLFRWPAQTLLSVPLLLLLGASISHHVEEYERNKRRG